MPNASARSHIGSLRLQTPKACQDDLPALAAVPEALKQKFDHEVTNASDRRDPAQHRRGADDGGQPGLLR